MINFQNGPNPLQKHYPQEELLSSPFPSFVLSFDFYIFDFNTVRIQQQALLVQFTVQFLKLKYKKL